METREAIAELRRAISVRALGLPVVSQARHIYLGFKYRMPPCCVAFFTFVWFPRRSRGVHQLSEFWLDYGDFCVGRGFLPCPYHAFCTELAYKWKDGGEVPAAGLPRRHDPGWS